VWGLAILSAGAAACLTGVAMQGMVQGCPSRHALGVGWLVVMGYPCQDSQYGHACIPAVQGLHAMQCCPSTCLFRLVLSSWGLLMWWCRRSEAQPAAEDLLHNRDSEAGVCCCDLRAAVCVPCMAWSVLLVSFAGLRVRSGGCGAQSAVPGQHTAL
jgi:hypothetical protein